MRLFALRSVTAAFVTVLAGVSLLLGGGAASATIETNNASTANAAATSAASCTVWNLSSELVPVYSQPDTSSAAWGFLWGGSSAQCAYPGSSTVWGAHHNLCGGGSLYAAVYYRIGDDYVIGFVPDACVWVAY
jgi:hypothetical protein